ncbi:glutathione S-transferase F11-like [Humulus lupulus]|uniref:glutathione S-transferase F11-like n=1 Tax=Humulus lupulus TaxID=3486 RepID=UPI002B406723|nr:glutathione S-transferase F11-like [Humulus lupulus]
MVVKVYGSLRSACTQRVLACFLEKGIEYEIVHVDLQTAQHKRPQFLLLQPFGQVPVIEEGEFRLFESRAIIRYYATKYADEGAELLGATAEERAIVDQWVEVESNNFNELVYTLVLQILILPSMGEVGNLALVHSCEEKLVKVLDVYEERLGKSKYLGGDAFSLADLTHLPAIRYLVNEIKMGHLVAERKNVKAWWETISNRPAWKKLINTIN